MDTRCFGFFFVSLSLTVVAIAYDPDTLQDLCVADRTSGTRHRQLCNFSVFAFVFLSL